MTTTMFLLVSAISTTILCVVFTALDILWRRLQVASFRFNFWPLQISLLNVVYSRTALPSSSSPTRTKLGSLIIQPNFPTWRKPCLCTIQLVSLEHKDSLHEVEVGNIEVSINIPLPFYGYRQRHENSALSEDVDTEGVPPSLRRNKVPAVITILLPEFRVRVYASKETPLWLDKMRRNLIFTVLNGTFLHAKHTSVKTDSIREFLSPKDEEVAKNGEMRVTANVQDWLLYNQFTTRLYAFGSIDAQLRVYDNVDHPEPSSFAMIARSCSWTRSMTPWKWSWTRLVDVHVTRTDVAFDSFRLRDAEPVMQGMNLVSAWWNQKTPRSVWDECLTFLSDMCAPSEIE